MYMEENMEELMEEEQLAAPEKVVDAGSWMREEAGAASLMNCWTFLQEEEGRRTRMRIAASAAAFE